MARDLVTAFVIHNLPYFHLADQIAPMVAAYPVEPTFADYMGHLTFRSFRIVVAKRRTIAFRICSATAFPTHPFGAGMCYSFAFLGLDTSLADKAAGYTKKEESETGPRSLNVFRLLAATDIEHVAEMLMVLALSLSHIPYLPYQVLAA